MRFALDDMPMPPTQNQIYATDFKTGRRFKAKVYGDYLKMVNFWASERQALLNQIHTELSYWVNKKYRIAVHSFYAWPANKINTSGDPSNRIKAQHDALKNMIRIDDRYFTIRNCENVLTQDDPYAILILEPVKIVTDEQVRQEVLGWPKTTDRDIL